MVKHVVCFKFIDKANVGKAAELLRSMKGKVAVLRDIEVGENFLESERAYDLILITTFDRAEDIDVYQKDEYHVNVVKEYMHKNVAKSVAVDWTVKE